MRKLLYLVPVALFAVLLVAFAMGLNHDPSLLPSAMINRPAPNFDLPGLYDPAKGLSAQGSRRRRHPRQFLRVMVCAVPRRTAGVDGACPPARRYPRRHRLQRQARGVATFPRRSRQPLSPYRRSIRTERPRSISGFTACPRPMSSIPPVISAIAMSGRSANRMSTARSCR